MPKTKISEFSATPGNNTDIDGINIAEGCPPSGINDAIRELMAQLKDFQAGTAGDSFNGPIGSTTPAAGTFTNLSASGTFALTGDQVQISEGGTGQTTANAAFNALAPSQSTHAGKYLKTDGTNTSWDALDISTADITGTLPIANGGTGLTALGTGVQTALGQNVTGSGGIVLASSPSLTTPNLGTPSAVTLTNATGLPLSTGVTGTLATTNGGTGLTSFTANGVVYASSTSALTTGSALTFNGTNLFTLIPATGTAYNRTESTQFSTWLQTGAGNANVFWEFSAGTPVRWVDTSAGELMRLTSTGLGIGTTSPVGKIGVVSGTAPNIATLYVGVSGSNNYYDANTHYFRNGSQVDNMVLTTGGLGIGTSSPSAKLHVQGTYGYFADGTYNGYFGKGNGVVVGGGAADLGISTSTGAIVFGTGGSLTERMRLDTSGNLGLGVTPSAWVSPDKVIQFGNGSPSIGTQYSGDANFMHNAYESSAGTFRYIQSAGAPRYQLNINSNEHRWYTAPSWNGTGSDIISFTQAMTLDASGRLLVGTTTAVNDNNLKIQLNTNATDTQRFISVNNNGDFGLLMGFVYNDQANIRTVWNYPLVFGTYNTERARITSGGYFKASNTGSYQGSTSGYHELRTDNNTYIAYFTNSNAAPNGTVIEYGGAAPNGTGNLFLYCGDTGGERASVRSNGGLANYSGNNVNLSDRREKTNFSPAKDYLDTICAIPVQTFNYIDQSEDDPGLTLGVVAQDVQAVAPELVMESNWGTKEDPKMRLSIYQTDLQYALMKCIQELKAQNDDLRARVAQLEAK